LNCVVDDLRTQPRHLWKHVLKLKNNYQNLTQIKGVQLIAETFAERFGSTFNSMTSTFWDIKSTDICLLLGLLLDHDNGGDVFLRNIAVTSKKAEFFIITAVRTSNHACSSPVNIPRVLNLSFLPLYT
jgi:hypothetical protein